MRPNDVKAMIEIIYSENKFMHYCDIKIISVSCGKARVGLTVDPERHTNLNNKLHGGLLMTLMDNATGIAAASVGKRVVTVSMTVDFIKGADTGETVEAEAVISYQDKSAVMMNINVYNDKNKIIATGISSMLIIADFPEIPAKW